MHTKKLSQRKPDLLDEITELRKRRGIAYRAGHLITLEQVHQEMKAFWMDNGWTADEAQEEYLAHVEECKIPYDQARDELTLIKGSLLLLEHNWQV